MRRLQLNLKSLLDSGIATGLMVREKLRNGYDWVRGAICGIANPIAFIAEKSCDLRVASEAGDVDLVMVSNLKFVCSVIAMN